MDKIKQLEQEIADLKDQYNKNLFPVFADSGKIQDAIRFLDRSTAFEMQLLADIVLVTSPLMLKLNENEEIALFQYMNDKKINIEKIMQGSYTLFRQATYEQLVDARSGFWDNVENEAVFSLYDKEGKNCGFMLEKDIPLTKNLMIRTHTGGIKYNG